MRDGSGYLLRSNYNPHPSQYGGLVHPTGFEEMSAPIRVGTNLLVIGSSVAEITARVLEPSIITRLGPTVIVASSQNLSDSLKRIVLAQGSKFLHWTSGNSSFPSSLASNETQVAWNPFYPTLNCTSAISLARDLILTSSQRLKSWDSL